MIFQNLHILTGNLAHDAELQIVSGGRRVVHLRIYTEYRTTRDGQTRRTSTTHAVTAWGTLAEAIAHWRKGDLVHIEGPVFEREMKPTDGSKPRKLRELYADIAYRVDLGPRAGKSSAATDESAPAPLASSSTAADDDWPV